MNSLLPFIVTGLVSGSVYGLAGSGLVLTYKTSGVFNFGHGALATISAYLFYWLHDVNEWSWQASAAVCVLGLGVALGLGFEMFTRRIVRAPTAQQIAGTVGLMVLVQAAATVIFGPDPIQALPFLPDDTFELGGVMVTTAQVIIVAIGLVLTGALYAFLRGHRMGIAMRAVVDNPDLVSLSEFSPYTIRRFAWLVGCTLATLSGVLLAPLVVLAPAQLTLLVVQAFGAAAIGRFASLPLTYVGGLMLGVAASVCTRYFGDTALAGLSASIPFLVLFVVLIVTPKARLRLATLRQVPLRLTSRLRMPARVQALAAAPLLVLALLAPLLSGRLLPWAAGLAFVILFASMVLLVRVAGQVSLCHVSFAAIGAATFARMAGQQGVPWFVALVVAALVVVPIGALLAIPASRLPILFLGLATLGFGLLVQQMFYSTDLMFSRFAQGLTVGRPKLGGLDLTSDIAYYYVVLLFAVVSVLVIAVLVRTRLGRVLRGLSDSPLALNALGADERVARVLVFCVSAFFAGLSGALYAGLLGNVADTTFDPMFSLTYLVLIVIAIGDVVWAAVVAAIGAAVLPALIDSGETNQYLQLIFGAIAMFVAAGPGHEKVAAWAHGKLARFAQASDDAAGMARSAKKPPQSAPARVVERSRPKDLEIDNVSVRFGGLRAVDGVSLTARGDAITGLIGPNGAGKTTTFNVASGVLKPGSGKVAFDGRDITGMGMARRARQGLGRTFQQTELFTSMSVLENVALGHEAAVSGASPISQVVSRPSQRHLRAAAVERAIALCDLHDLASIPVAELTTGQRRRVELARCLASPARLLLLDEPSAGLDHAETAAFGEVLRRVKNDHGIGILLVEHDMDLVMSVCEYVYVLDFGQLIFQGTPAEVRESTLVQAAYLGEPAAPEDAAEPLTPLNEVRQR